MYFAGSSSAHLGRLCARSPKQTQLLSSQIRGNVEPKQGHSSDVPSASHLASSTPLSPVKISPVQNGLVKTKLECVSPRAVGVAHKSVILWDEKHKSDVLPIDGLQIGQECRSLLKTNGALLTRSLMKSRETSPRAVGPKRFCHNGNPTKQAVKYDLKITPPHELRKQMWSYDVKPFGCFMLQDGQHLKVTVKPIDVVQYPNQDKAFVKLKDMDDSNATLHSSFECSIDEETIITKQGSVDIDTDEDLVECTVEIPIKFELDMYLEGRSEAHIESFENDSIFVQLQHGKCHMKDIKSGGISVLSTSGDIACDGVLQGDARMDTKSGSIVLQKPLCLNLTAVTESGNIDVGDLYADHSMFKTTTGNIHIGSGHRLIEAKIKEQGNLSIGTLDGSLNAKVKKGNVDIHISELNNVYISVDEGDVILKMSESLYTGVVIEADNITIDENLNQTRLSSATSETGGQVVTGDLGSKEADPFAPIKKHLVVKTSKGNVTLKCQGWLDTLKLKKPEN